MQKEKIFNRKIFYAQKDSSASESSDESSSEDGTSKLILMALEEDEKDFLEQEQEGEVYIEGELISALDEIERLKLKNRKQKEILLKYIKEE